MPSLQIQKYNRELELIIKVRILTAVRDSIPREEIQEHMEETQENDTVARKEEVVSEQVIDDTPADQVMVNDVDASTEESGLSQS